MKKPEHVEKILVSGTTGQGWVWIFIINPEN